MATREVRRTLTGLPASNILNTMLDNKDKQIGRYKPIAIFAGITLIMIFLKRRKR
jgi:hypothetical protein